MGEATLLLENNKILFHFDKEIEEEARFIFVQRASLFSPSLLAEISSEISSEDIHRNILSLPWHFFRHMFK